jgi:hypothetical protein
MLRANTFYGRNFVIIRTFIFTGRVLLICSVSELLVSLLGIIKLSSSVLNYQAAELSLF